MIIPKAVASKDMQGVHSHSHPGVDKTPQLLHKRYKSRGCTPTKVWELVEHLIQRCDTCQTCKPGCGRHPETGQYYPIPKYPFASVAMDIVHLQTCEGRKGYTVNCCFVIVDRKLAMLWPYLVPLRVWTPAQRLNFVWKSACFSRTFPSGILRAKCFNNKFVTTLCNLAGISTHESLIYGHKTNGRAKRAVKSVVETLRVYLQETNTPASQWYWSVLMALWGLNDLSGAIAPYSPHCLLFRSDHIVFCNMPPIVDDNGCEDALDFFLRLGRERGEIQQKLAAIHKKHGKELHKTHSKKIWEIGDRVWVCNLPKHDDHHFDKLAGIWSGPYEILEIMGGGRYHVATSQEARKLGIGRFKLALLLLSGVKLNGDDHTLRPPPEDNDTWVVEDVVYFQEVPSARVKGKVQKWRVEWNIHQAWTWETMNKCLHHVCPLSRAYNAKHGIRVPF